MVARESGWKSPDIMVSVSWGEIPPRCGKSEFLFPCWCLDIVKIDKTPLIFSFNISIGGAWSIVYGVLAYLISPVATGLVLCET